MAAYRLSELIQALWVCEAATDLVDDYITHGKINPSTFREVISELEKMKDNMLYPIGEFGDRAECLSETDWSSAKIDIDIEIDPRRPDVLVVVEDEKESEGQG